MAFDQCSGLVGADGLCRACVAPHLIIVPGATMHAPVGGSVTLPFDLMNASDKDRPLFITGLWSREGSEWREERLGWEELGPKHRASASVVARDISKPGTHEIEIMFAVATRFKQREERFAFSTRVLLTIQGESSSVGPTIQISSENEMNGNVIQIHDNNSGSDVSTGKVIDAIDMKLVRLDLEERTLGLRGMDDGSSVRRSAAFEFTGFPGDHHIPSGLPPVTPDGLLIFGREKSRQNGGTSDVRILATDANGKLDREISKQISRRHFDVFLENDCLIIRARGRNGLRLNGKALPNEARATLNDGDRIEPLVDHGELIALKVRFSREHNRVTGVKFVREPALESVSQ
ncbi:MAG: FHA domain-containing protein [Erythrobacter sp.]